MKAQPLIVNWHDQNSPIYSAHFEPHGKGRLATGGGDNNVRLWHLDHDGEDRKISYLATLSKHTQAVNCVRWAPKGEVLASAGDDGNIILWVESETHGNIPTIGRDGIEDKETWRTKHMCRSSGAEIYDLAWSPDGVYFIIGSMDNVARIYNASTGQLVRQIAEHQHFVQGVAWDPLNEYIATQSSDRSVHIYTLKTKDGHYTLDNREQEPKRVGYNLKMDLPGRRVSSHSPAPPDMGFRSQISNETTNNIGSPGGPSCPGTPTSLALPMNPPSAISHSRRSSFGASSPAMSMRRSASPAPSLPLPAVMPMDSSPKPFSLGMKNSNIYANDTLKSFFRRLTFTPDGSLLFTPAGQYQTQHKGPEESSKPLYEVTNTVYIYTRGGINKPPIAHLPGHKKPSVVVNCSPVFFTVRRAPPPTKHFTIDTSSTEGSIPALPEPALAKPRAYLAMEPPPPVQGEESSPSKFKLLEVETNAVSPGPTMAFSLPYRMVYAVATEDSVLLYDTQQQTPLCVVSNLHCATFTDLSWSSDGHTLLVTSSDGFCSTLTFSSNELGEKYVGDVPTVRHPYPHSSAVSSAQNTPMATPTNTQTPTVFPLPGAPHFYHGGHHHRNSSSSAISNSTPIATTPPILSGPTMSSHPVHPNQIRPSSPTRSNSTSSVATQSSHITPATSSIISNPHLVSGNLPGIGAGNPVMAGYLSGLPMTTPPQTPRSMTSSVVGTKRDAPEGDSIEDSSHPSKTREEDGNGADRKKRRVAPTLVADHA